MKVFIAIVLAFGAVSAIGSGPYLPSGWRPKGPAFLLPSEVQKSEPVPLEAEKSEPTSAPTTEKEELVEVTEAISVQTSEDSQDQIQESEASGSDFLREYGPPAVVDIKAITEQSLPDLETKRPFAVIDAKFSQESSAVEDETLQSEVQTDTSVEAGITAPALTIVEDSNTEVEVNQEASTTEASVSEDIAEVTNGEDESVSEEVTTLSAIEDVQKDVDEPLKVTLEESQVNTVGSLEYLPPALNEVNSEDVLLKGKSLESSEQENAGASLEYLPPSTNEGENTEEVAIPLYKAKLETESEANVVANAESLPSSNQIDGNVNSIVNNNEDATKTEPESERKASDETVVDVNQDVTESSGQEPALKEEERIGFREYGLPREVVVESASTDSRKRRFSSKFVPLRRH